MSYYSRYYEDVKAKPIIDVVGTVTAIQRVAAAIGIKVELKEGLKQPYTDLKKKVVYLPTISPYCTEEELLEWKGMAYHEYGHHHPDVSDTLPFMEENGFSFDSVLGIGINIVDDYRQEKVDLGIYAGRSHALSCLQALACARGAKIIGEHGLEGADDKSLFTAMALGPTYRARHDWMPEVVAPSVAYDKVVDWESNYSHIPAMFDKLDTIEDVYNIVIAMLDASPEHDTEEEIEKAKEAKQGEGDGECEEAEGGDGKSDGSDSDQDGDSEEEGEGKVSYKDLMNHVHDGEVSEGDYNTEIVYDHDAVDDYVPWQNMTVMKARDLHRVHKRTLGGITDMYKKDRSLAMQARRLFQSRTQSRISHNHETGRLDRRDLYRIPSGAKDVFKRKAHTPDPKGTAVFMLNDASGSMCDTKFIVTSVAAALMNDACSPLGIPLKIASFTEKTGGCEHYIVKEYDERRKSEEMHVDHAKIYNKLYQNADGESVMWAAKDLMARPEERKILIVLSDGCPASDNYGDCYTYTKSVIEHVRKWPRLELYGIGILDDTVKYLYPEFEVLEDVNQLEACLLNLIKTKIFGV